MEVFNFICIISGFIANIATLITCFPIFIAGWSYLRNRISEKTVIANIKFNKPHFVSGYNQYVLDFVINIENLTSQTFYIKNLKLITNNKQKEIHEIKQEIIKFLPKKINAYETALFACAVFVNDDFILPKNTSLKFNIGRKILTYSITV